MRVVFFVITLISCFAAVAQKPCMQYEDDYFLNKEKLHGPVKRICIQRAGSAYLKTLNALPFSEGSHRVDSFDKEMYMVASYNFYYEPPDSVGPINYTFDTKGRIVETSQFSMRKLEKQVYEYDALGRLYTQKYYDSDVLTEGMTYTYPSAHEIIREKDRPYSDSSKTVIYECNRKCQVVKETLCTFSGKINTGKYTYDRQGNKILEEWDGGSYTRVYKYDKFKNVVLLESFKNCNLTERIGYKYTYDEQGNWVRCIESTSEYPWRVTIYALTIREIEYY